MDTESLLAYLVSGHNEELLDDLDKFATFVFPSALFLRLFPPFLRPVLSYGITIFNRIYKYRVVKTLGPYVKLHVEEALKNKTLTGEAEPLPREDILTWLIADSMRRKESGEGLADRITCRVFIAAFAAIETTTLTVSNALFDLCASDPSSRVWDDLAEEGCRILSEPQLTLNAVNNLARADSALKETLRLRTSIKALSTQVTSADGISLDGFDIQLSQGSRLAVSAWGIHHNEDLYPNASQYDAFRFSRPREKKQGIATTIADVDGSKAHLMVSANENYLPFGLGRHSCPGRHFAAVESKLFLAYLASHYDLQLAGQAPSFTSVGHFPIPPLKGKLMIRRKRSTFEKRSMLSPGVAERLPTAE